jgi:tRNA 2-selenouridine synthase
MPCTFVEMAVTKLSLNEFLDLAKHRPVLDVRSPGEFSHAHIPGAHSFPLFTDEERKVVGTAYKQQSKQIAVKIGLQYFGPRMVQMVEEAEALVASFEKSHHYQEEQKTVLVHCWRGGMRSAGVAWMLDLYGFKVYTLSGGYKAYRNWVLEQFEKSYPIRILGGFTGSGKTEVLKAMAGKGATIIDLEGLAHHKGSAFGALGQPAQPTQEHFENQLARALWQTGAELVPAIEADGTASEQSVLPFAKSGSVIWLEDESQRIGLVNIPSVFFQQMREKKVVFLDIPFEERLNFIVTHYGKFDKDKLVNAVMRVKKKLGGLETKTAVNALIEDDVKLCFDVLLQYYDKLYKKGLLRREDPSILVTTIACETVDAAANAAAVIRLSI